MASSCYAVLQTAELLQEILLQLDMRTLLTVAQLVSRQWHALITSSPPLQRALYLKPIVQSSSPATLNPLLVDAFPLWFQLADEVNTKRSKMIRKEDFDSLPMAQESRRPAFMHPSASWRHMLVQQPPSLRLGYWTLTHSMRGYFQDLQIREFPDGLQMGSLYDLSQHWACQDDAGFDVLWDLRVVTMDWNHSHGNGFEPGKKAEIQSFASQAGNIVLYCCVATQCIGELPDSRFEETFTFAPSEEQEDEWRQLREYRREILT
ncbi:hypothetical protein F4679DRAFT_579544 [Xylaria curta]|nr:hypothetical protein F4679DRAFT_579544 [Xylaria curta]